MAYNKIKRFTKDLDIFFKKYFEEKNKYGYTKFFILKLGQIVYLIGNKNEVFVEKINTNAVQKITNLQQIIYVDRRIRDELEKILEYYSIFVKLKEKFFGDNRAASVIDETEKNFLINLSKLISKYEDDENLSQFLKLLSDSINPELREKSELYEVSIIPFSQNFGFGYFKILNGLTPADLKPKLFFIHTYFKNLSNNENEKMKLIKNIFKFEVDGQSKLWETYSEFLKTLETYIESNGFPYIVVNRNDVKKLTETAEKFFKIFELENLIFV